MEYVLELGRLELDKTAFDEQNCSFFFWHKLTLGIIILDIRCFMAEELQALDLISIFTTLQLITGVCLKDRFVTFCVQS